LITKFGNNGYKQIFFASEMLMKIIDILQKIMTFNLRRP